MKKFQIAVDDNTFHGCEIGDNSLPSLVCLHGMTGDLNSFSGIIEYLINDFHLILIDNPGHGETDSLKLEEDYMFSSLAKNIYQVIKKITNKPFYMLGHSWGADICLHVAGIFPSKVKGVILLDGGYAFPEHVDGLTEEKALIDWKDYVESSIYSSWDEVVKEYQGYTTKQWDTNLNSLIASSFKKVKDNYIFKADVFSIQAIIKAFYKEPCSTTFGSIQCPVLLLHATIEPTDSARKKGVQEIKKGIKVLKVIGIENTQHNLHWDDPEKVANEILLWKQDIKQEVY
ncbi:alpha/beta fold hydrolase [Sporosarcina sp. D27]|uniref:alpha/beta fold hydrolase n=1 Tax=Sporosarcina sp. D27 TaxID=1382305 RepID=UPI00046EE787|nr:alpha/beta hydrolase [Sporosarcina sp. D27]